MSIQQTIESVSKAPMCEEIRERTLDKLKKLQAKSSAQMDGPTLKLAREAAGLGLHEVAIALCMKVAQLELIEKPGGWVIGNWQHPLVLGFDRLYGLAVGVQRCRHCGCSDVDGSGCHAKLGKPCQFVEKDLCSACVSRGMF